MGYMVYVVTKSWTGLSDQAQHGTLGFSGNLLNFTLRVMNRRAAGVSAVYPLTAQPPGSSNSWPSAVSIVLHVTLPGKAGNSNSGTAVVKHLMTKNGSSLILLDPSRLNHR